MEFRCWPLENTGVVFRRSPEDFASTRLRHRRLNRRQQDEEASDDMGLREFDLVPSEESLQYFSGAC
jgi:hypothetical protein